MGLKLYRAGIAMGSYAITPTEPSSMTVNTGTFYDIAGNSHTKVAVINSNYGLAASSHPSFKDMTCYASSDTSFNKDDNTVTGQLPANISAAKTYGDYSVRTTYTIAVEGGANGVTVGSLKFTRMLYYNYNNYSGTNCLVCGYFFDTPITVPAGETKTIVFTFAYEN